MESSTPMVALRLLKRKDWRKIEEGKDEEKE
jgi:hypothetical protein